MFQIMSGHKTINIESINFKGKRYHILCDKLEIRISINGGYKRFRNKTSLNEIRSLSSFLNLMLIFLFTYHLIDAKSSILMIVKLKKI